MLTPVLATKLFVPPLRPNVVLRAELISRLSGGFHRRLTLISAPAGFGKTSLASAWIAGCGWPAAWVSLDADGEVFTSITSGTPLAGVDLLGLVAANSLRLTGGAFFTLLMGISLAGMTVFLYPILRKDSAELALGMLLFCGALEGTFYVISTLSFLTLVALGNEYVVTGTDSPALQSMGSVLYQFLGFNGAIGSIVFLIGTTCL
jgi:hypothetical protein